MLSLEEYCERRLQGKSIKRIQKEVTLLRAKINLLESREEKLDPISAYFFRKKNKINYKSYVLNRRLECAIKALVKNGGEYVPTRKECEAIEFDKNLEMIKYIIFYTAHGNWEYRTDIMIVSDDKILVAVNGNGFGIGEGDTYELFTTKPKLIEKLKELHLNEWRKEYYAPILDGTSWKIILVSTSYTEIIRIIGSNETPYNFDDFRKVFSKFKQ